MKIKDFLKDLAKMYNVTIWTMADINPDAIGYTISIDYLIKKGIVISKTFYIDTPGYSNNKNYKCSSTPICIEVRDQSVNIDLNKKAVVEIGNKIQFGYDTVKECADEFMTNYKKQIIDGLKSGELK